MKKAALTLLTASFMSGCVTAQQRAEKDANMHRDMDIASDAFQQSDFMSCMDDYKPNMLDPSSFQMAGEPYLNDVYTGVSYGTTWDNGPARRVIYTVRVRGENAYGGLVIGEVHCIYGVSDSDIWYFGYRS